AVPARAREQFGSDLHLREARIRHSPRDDLHRGPPALGHCYDACGLSAKCGTVASSAQIASGICQFAHLIVSATLWGLLTPHTVEVTRWSRIENCRATAPGGTSCRVQIASTFRIESRTSARAARYE